MLNKIYIKHIYNIYFTRLMYISLIFCSLIFIMNILEELKFFDQYSEIGLGVPILLTVLNLPSILFEIFPFIILITTQFFFIKFQNNDEILIFKNNGINNLKLVFLLSLLVFIVGIFIVTIFHFISSNMKYSYLEFKNKYTKDQKYLAVINENGLWIKDNLDGKSMIIHSEKIEKNILKNIIVTIFDDNFRSDKSIIAKEATITNKSWKLKDTIISNSDGKKDFIDGTYILETNFDYIKINSIFSNLESLNIFELFKQRSDFKSVGLNISEINLYINKIFSIPISLVIFSMLSCILMFNVNFKKSKVFMIIIGILCSVVIYYIYYFFGLLGNNNKVPITLAVWLPNLILILICTIGILNLNEK